MGYCVAVVVFTCKVTDLEFAIPIPTLFLFHFVTFPFQKSDLGPNPMSKNKVNMALQTHFLVLQIVDWGRHWTL